AASAPVIATRRRSRRLTGRAAFGRQNPRGADAGARTAEVSRSVIEWPRLQAARGAEHHDRRVLLVFRRRLDLFQRQFERDALLLVGNLSEMKRAPVDHDLAAADAEEAAEIDHRRAHGTGAVDDHVDDAPHVLAGRAADVASENAARLIRADHRDRRWRHQLFRTTG